MAERWGGATMNFAAQPLAHPRLLDDEITVVVHIDLIGKTREEREKGDFVVEIEIAQLAPIEWERRLAIDSLAACMDTWRRVVQREPKVGLGQARREAVHRDIFAPEPARPALDDGRHLDVFNAREIGQPSRMDKGHHTCLALHGHRREVLQAVAQDGQCAALPQPDRRHHNQRSFIIHVSICLV